MNRTTAALREVNVLVDEAILGRVDEGPRDVWPIGLKLGWREPAGRATVLAPVSPEQVQAIVAGAGRAGLTVQVEGGRSNVVGALTQSADILLSTIGLDAIGALDEVSQTITVGAGVLGSRLEAILQERGFTLGHYPQSLLTSTVGGWIATRATGTASALHGGIERLVCGLDVVLPSGELVQLQRRPRAPGGLDAIALFCGSEGSLGIVTAATLTVSRRLADRRLAAAFPTFETGLVAQRELLQRRLPIAVLRLMNDEESRAITAPGSIGDRECLLLGSLEGESLILEAADPLAQAIVVAAGGASLGAEVGAAWWDTRYAPPGLIEERNTATGQMFDTIEVSVPWSSAAQTAADMHEEIGPLVEHLWLHSSHAYTTGTCLYLAFWIGAEDDARAVQICREVWRRMVAIVQKHGGSPAHHHGIGAVRSGIYVGSPEGRLHQSIKGALDAGGVLAARLLEGDDPAVGATGGTEP